MKTIFSGWFLVMGLVLSMSWNSTGWAKIRIVTTLPSFADIARNVAADQADVVSLTKGTQDPHFVDAKPDLILRLNRADFLIRAGLGLEDGWLPPLLVGARNAKILAGAEGNLDASTLMQLKEIPAGGIDRSMGDVHPGGNPHYMLDPRNGVKLAKGIAERLSKIAPEEAAEFRRRAEDYSKRLEAQITQWLTALKPLAGKPVVTYHKSWIYFVDWLGLKDVGHVEPKPGIPPSPEHVVTLIRLMKEKKVKLLFMEPYYPKGTAEHIAKETAARLLVLPTEVLGNPEATTYFGIFEQLARKLKAEN